MLVSLANKEAMVQLQKAYRELDPTHVTGHCDESYCSLNLCSKNDVFNVKYSIEINLCGIAIFKPKSKNEGSRRYYAYTIGSLFGHDWSYDFRDKEFVTDDNTPWQLKSVVKSCGMFETIEQEEIDKLLRCDWTKKYWCDDSAVEFVRLFAVVVRSLFAR